MSDHNDNEDGATKSGGDEGGGAKAIITEMPAGEFLNGYSMGYAFRIAAHALFAIVVRAMKEAFKGAAAVHVPISAHFQAPAKIQFLKRMIVDGKVLDDAAQELQDFMRTNGQKPQAKTLGRRKIEYASHVRPIAIAWKWIRDRAKKYGHVDLDTVWDEMPPEVRNQVLDARRNVLFKAKLKKMPDDKRAELEKKTRDKFYPPAPTSRETKEVKTFIREAHKIYEFCEQIAGYPKWLAMCRACFTAANLPFVKDDGRVWDLYTLGKVVVANLPEHLAVRPFETLVGNAFGVVDTMLKRLLHTIELRTWRAHKNPPTKPEVLQCLSDLATVMEIFGCDETAIQKIREMHKQANKLCSGNDPQPTIRKDAAKELAFYRMFNEFEARMGSVKGKDGRRLVFKYDKQTIAFPNADAVATPVQIAAIRSLEFKERNRPIAAGRHWIHHSTKDTPDFVQIARFCGEHLTALGDDGDWPWSDGFTWLCAQTTPTVTMGLSAVDTSNEVMRIARPKERYFVGDPKQIQDVVNQLKFDAPTTSIRIVVSGVAGVGKDTFVAECVRHKVFSTLDGWLQGWIVATSRGSFEQTLFELFRGRWAGVVAGCENDRAKALGKIREWLETHDRWFLVIEDLLPAEIEAFEKWIPKNKGKVLVTSKSPTPEMGTDGRIKLKPFQLDMCVTLWGRMGVAGSLAKLMPEDELKKGLKSVADENTLKQACNGTAQAGVFDDSGHATTVPYAAPTKTNESAGAKQKRWKGMLRAIWAETQLRRKDLATFFEEDIAGLPYFVYTSGNLLKKAGLTVDETIREVHTGSVESVQREGFDARHNKYARGLNRSMLVPFKRLCADVTETERTRATAMLMAMSVLPNARVPERLFLKEEDDGMVGLEPSKEDARRLLEETTSVEDGGGATKSESTMLEEENDEAVFCFGLSRKAYEATRRMLVESGVVGESGGDRRHVGFMHQLGQRCVRESRVWLAEGSAFLNLESFERFLCMYFRQGHVAGGARPDASMWRAVMRELRNALERYFNRTRIRGDPRRYWLELREIAPCVESVLRMDPVEQRAGAASGSGGSVSRGDDGVALARTDADLCLVLPEFYQTVQSDLGSAKAFAERALEMLYAVEPEGEKAKTSGIATSLHQLGHVLQAIGDLMGARAKDEASLEMHYAIHPEGKKAKTSRIASSLHNLGSVLEAIGDLKGARAKYEASLEMMYAIHPEGKKARTSGIATSLHQLGNVLYMIGDLRGARAKYEASLEMKYVIHPEGKKANTSGTAASLGQLGGVLYAIGDLKGARAKFKASLEMRYAIHPKGKKAKTSGIASSLHQLGNVLYMIGDLKGARAKYEASLEMEYAIHPEGKKAKTSGIGATLSGLTAVARSLRDFDASLAYALCALEITDSMFSDVDAFHSSTLTATGNVFQSHLDAGSSYETILDFVTDRHRRLMSGQASSNQSASRIAQVLAQWESEIAYVRRTEKDIRGKHRRSVKLRAGCASAACKQAARAASSAAKFAKRVAESNLKQDTTKKTTKKKTKKKKKKKKRK